MAIETGREGAVGTGWKRTDRSGQVGNDKTGRDETERER